MKPVIHKSSCALGRWHVAGRARDGGAAEGAGGRQGRATARHRLHCIGALAIDLAIPLAIPLVIALPGEEEQPSEEAADGVEKP